jgi:uroporphyrinogen-III decarboxylase
MIWRLFGRDFEDGRGMHMCGDSNHLLETLAKDAKITSFNVFGFPTDLNKVAEHLGGKTYLWGNINPMLMLDNTVSAVKEAVLNCLSTLAPCGGFMLGDGANVCPGTPGENLAALTEASQEYGLPTKRDNP